METLVDLASPSFRASEYARWMFSSLSPVRKYKVTNNKSLESHRCMFQI